MKKILVNPGHDVNKDPGAVNKILNLTEANIVRVIGDMVSAKLTASDYEVCCLQDNYLTGVITAANNWQADIFVSIHCNGFNSPQANGTETLYYSGSAAGKRLAQCLQDSLVGEFGLTDRGIKSADWAGVLKSTDMPAVIVEMAFITNDREARLMYDQPARWADAIVIGIENYFEGR